VEAAVRSFDRPVAGAAGPVTIRPAGANAAVGREAPMNDAQTRVQELRLLIAEFVAARQWERYHDPKNLAMSIAIEAAELMEHFQWVRSDEVAQLLRDESVRSEVQDELADVVCYVLALANVLDLDLSAAVTEKVRKNGEKYPAERFQGSYRKPRGGASEANATGPSPG
jgi:NTP pyrophosphatase (non-canonical NTP hydrolase)